MIAFANAIFAASVEEVGIPITGVRVVRYTNVSTGYGTWRIDAFGKAPATPKQENNSPNYLPRERKVTADRVTCFLWE